MDRTQIYYRIFDTIYKEMTKTHTEDKASRISNRFAVKYTWEVWNLLSGPHAFDLGMTDDFFDRRSPLCILPIKEASSDLDFNGLFR